VVSEFKLSVDVAITGSGAGTTVIVKVMGLPMQPPGLMQFIPIEGGLFTGIFATIAFVFVLIITTEFGDVHVT